MTTLGPFGLRSALHREINSSAAHAAIEVGGFCDNQDLREDDLKCFYDLIDGKKVLYETFDHTNEWVSIRKGLPVIVRANQSIDLLFHRDERWRSRSIQITSDEILEWSMPAV